LKYRHLRAPATFSLLANPEESIAFLNDIEAVSQDHHIDLDISSVCSLTPDAIAALTSTIGRPKFENRNVRGNLPKDPVNQQILYESGFFDHVKSRYPLPAFVNRGIITKRQSQRVEGTTAAAMIRHGTKMLSGEATRSKPAYRVLVEAMGNTHNHAGGNKFRRETWWTTVYADRTRNRVCFTFVDTGVGIFKSIRMGPIRQVYNFLLGKTDTHILRDMLDGKVESSTGLPYRGRGLPSMDTLWRRGDLKRLVIITNNVLADVSANDFRTLKNSFHGTLLYWEI
jgi:hypothetical protein